MEYLVAILNIFNEWRFNDIAKQVGMSVVLLFHYFESKEKLYEELITIGISGPMSVMAHTDMEPIQFFESDWIIDIIRGK